MADLADVAMGPLGDRAEALALTEEVEALADRIQEWLEEGDLGSVARAMDLRVVLTGYDTWSLERSFTWGSIRRGGLDEYRDGGLLRQPVRRGVDRPL